MKVVEIKVAGTDREPLILDLWPGITAGDILAHADLADCDVASALEPTKFLSPEEALYDLLTDCETLIATFSTKQSDAYIRSFFNEDEQV